MTADHDGVPATNIGATVVTRSSEMIFGFVSAIRSDAKLCSVCVAEAASVVTRLPQRPAPLHRT